MPTSADPPFLTVPIQPAYLPARHPKNHTIRTSGTSLDLTYLACKTHGVHVLVFGLSRNSISPLSSLPCEFSGLSLPSRLPLSLAVLGVLPCHRADLRSPLSLSPPLCPFPLTLCLRPPWPMFVSQQCEFLRARVSSQDLRSRLQDQSYTRRIVRPLPFLVAYRSLLSHM